MIKQTNGTLENFTRSMGFVQKNPYGTTSLLPFGDIYQNTMDSVFRDVSSGAMDYSTAVNKATKQLFESGLKVVDYASKRKESIDVAVRRALLTGVSQLSAKISEYNAKQLDTDIVEVTAHAGARPDHAKWQGGWYSLSGKDKRYKDLRTETGYGTGAGLMGWNCRHSFFPVIPGIDEPKYTKEELENIDPPPKEIDGEKYTYYEAEQQQRYMERIMRKTKRELVVLQAAGDEEQFIWRSILLRGETEEYVDFCEKAGLIPRPDRYGAVGYGRVFSSKAKWSVRKAELKNGAEAAVSKTPRGENGGTAVVSVSGGSNGGTGKSYTSDSRKSTGFTTF